MQQNPLLLSAWSSEKGDVNSLSGGWAGTHAYGRRKLLPPLQIRADSHVDADTGADSGSSKALWLNSNEMIAIALFPRGTPTMTGPTRNHWYELLYLLSGLLTWHGTVFLGTLGNNKTFRGSFSIRCERPTLHVDDVSPHLLLGQVSRNLPHPLLSKLTLLIREPKGVEINISGSYSHERDSISST